MAAFRVHVSQRRCMFGLAWVLGLAHVIGSHKGDARSCDELAGFMRPLRKEYTLAFGTTDMMGRSQLHRSIGRAPEHVWRGSGRSRDYSPDGQRSVSPSLGAMRSPSTTGTVGIECTLAQFRVLANNWRGLQCTIGGGNHVIRISVYTLLLFVWYVCGTRDATQSAAETHVSIAVSWSAHGARLVLQQHPSLRHPDARLPFLEVVLPAGGIWPRGTCACNGGRRALGPPPPKPMVVVCVWFSALRQTVRMLASRDSKSATKTR